MVCGLSLLAGWLTPRTHVAGFGSQKPGVLPFTEADRAIDVASPNPGAQWFEKMISGYYLGEVTRRLLERLAEAGELWAGKVKRSKVSAPYSFDSRQASDVECDESDDLHLVREIEAAVWGVSGSSLPDRRLVQTVCRLVTERAARLTAAAIAAVVVQIDQTDPVTVAFDGSLYEAHSSFRGRLEGALELLGCRVRLKLSKDGSGLGAALVAAAASAD
jgi:hexokinase